MPIYRSISVKLHSQFDIETFPEYVPRSQDYYISRGLPVPADTPRFEDEATSTCSVYIPSYPASQFWLSYAVSPPVPEDQHFLFKLYINGAHIVSWSTGKEEKWKGKTMFALFETEDEGGRNRVEKRVLCFAKPDPTEGTENGVGGGGWFDEETCLEVRVHRALGRKRAERKIEEYAGTEFGKCERGVSLVNAGLAGSEQPKKFYKLALVDPVDKPFATFRYYYRTWAQILEMGLSEDEIVENGEDNDLSVIEPEDTDDSRNDRVEVRDFAPQDSGTVFRPSNDGAGDPPKSPRKTYINTASPRIRGGGSGIHSDEYARAPSHHDLSRTPSNYRLSVPPSCRFDPPQPLRRALPTIPQKHDPAADTSYKPHPVYPIDDWERKTPSPVQSLRETISTPTMERPKRGADAHGVVERYGWRMAASWYTVESVE
ncbi:uncharacterized protein N0V89_001477 [Didymosphaeria variabile]|uniref:Uncharacterized protein n=1 Tax=Didymosphaeria variabile TaxID=1932322 RepID=A0A9W8XX99_9PLEO|nr:uncharacterized protein N0V89_001477 [Didymosphaeria variabile]KAJ4360908.1 hypothetical protein N0V89_001477 [Didymosphaeria variabile]